MKSNLVARCLAIVLMLVVGFVNVAPSYAQTNYKPAAKVTAVDDYLTLRLGKMHVIYPTRNDRAKRTDGSYDNNVKLESVDAWYGSTATSYVNGRINYVPPSGNNTYWEGKTDKIYYTISDGNGKTDQGKIVIDLVSP